jgi:hypothetical protein
MSLFFIDLLLRVHGAGWIFLPGSPQGYSFLVDGGDGYLHL